MRKVLAAVAVCTLLLMCTAVNAAIVSEDIAYWYWINPGSEVGYIFNPTQQQLESILPDLVLKVQQTVYDPVQSAQILARDGHPVQDGGYLYAYSVTNLNWTEGLTGFRVNWQVQPLYVATSNRVTPSWWSVNNNASYPEWLCSPTDVAGIAPGESVGGFWAVAATGADGECDASAASITIGDGPQLWLTGGKTTGPLLPDPAPIVTLAAGLAGMGLTRLRRR